MIMNVLSKWQSGLVVFSVTILAISGGYGVYRYSSSLREQRAYKAFAESHDFFEQVLAKDSSANVGESMTLWGEVELAFKSGYAQNSRSSLAPYFLAFQAEALIHQGKLKDAIEVTDRMLGSLKKSSSLFSLYAVKRSLMKLDMPDEISKKEGLEELTNLANSEVNLNRDIALYYLGEYFWANNESKKARITWEYLQKMASVGKSPTPSPWFDLVKARLETI